MQHPVADGHDQARFLGQGDEFVGAAQASLGIVPADQGLDADDGAILEADLGLVVQGELVLVQGPAQAAFDGQPLGGLGGHGRREEMEGVAPPSLAVIHGHVGATDQGFDGGAVFRVHGDADGGGDDHLLAVDGAAAGNRLDQVHRHPGSGIGVTHFLEQDQEFVAALAADRVAAAHAGADALGRLLEQPVPGAMAQGIVHRLEAVQVDMQHRQSLAVATGPADGLAEPVGEQGPVGQTGEEVMLGEEADAGFRSLVFGDVGKEGHVAGHGASLVLDGDDGQPAGKQIAVLAPVGDLALPQTGAGQVAPHLGVEAAIVGAGAEHGRILTEDFRRAVAGQLQQGPVGPQDFVVGVADEDAFAAVVEDQGVELQLLSSQLPGGDVGLHNHRAAWRRAVGRRRCHRVGLEA